MNVFSSPGLHPCTRVTALNSLTLQWRMKNGWQEFHLIAEPVVREMAPGMKANLTECMYIFSW
nr:hypothetical protein [Paraburkholderia kirstenboschensis]